MPKRSTQAETASRSSDTDAARSRVVALTQELMRRMVALAGDLAATSGLNPSDLAALRALDAASADGVAVNALGAQLGLSSGAVTALVDRLEGHGLVERTRDDRDRRRVLVTLSPMARSFGAEHLMPLMNAIRSAVDGLERPDAVVVEGFLHRVLNTHHDAPPTAHPDPPPARSAASVGR